MHIRNKRLNDREFLKERKEVLAAWPTGAEVDPDEAAGYLKAMPLGKNYATKLTRVKNGKEIFVCSMMGTVPLEREIEFSQYLQNEGQTSFIPTVIDSLTRNGFFEKAEQEVKESEKTGRSLLNGFPIVHYGVAGSRRIAESVDLPLMTYGPTTDPRLIGEIALAGGHTGVSHGGPLCSFYHYTKTLPLETCIQNFQYVYRLLGYYEERGVPMQHRADGALYTMNPPCLTLAPQIIEHLLAAEQGVKHFECPYMGQGSVPQNVAAIITLRKLVDRYLSRFGYTDTVTTMIASYGVNFPYPSDHAQAYALVCLAPIVAVLGGAECCYVTTIDEAHKIPSKENNANSLRAARMMINMLKDQKIDLAGSRAVQLECEILERETTAIVERVLELGNGDVAVGAVRAVEAGVLDHPCGTSQRLARKVVGVRDAEGALRFLDPGNLPFDKDIVEFHREKIADREKAQGRKVDYDTVVNDIMAISKGYLFLPELSDKS
jgi:methylaspartate mutase epsilon subunit